MAIGKVVAVSVIGEGVGCLRRVGSVNSGCVHGCSLSRHARAAAGWLDVPSLWSSGWACVWIRATGLGASGMSMDYVSAPGVGLERFVVVVGAPRGRGEFWLYEGIDVHCRRQ